MPLYRLSLLSEPRVRGIRTETADLPAALQSGRRGRAAIRPAENLAADAPS